MKKWHVITAAVSTILGGYLHGFLYAPYRYDTVPIWDIGAILVGCFMGYVFWLLCALFVLAWREAK